jgi:cell division protein FtsN
MVRVDIGQNKLGMEIDGLVEKADKKSAKDMASPDDESADFSFYKVLGSKNPPKETVQLTMPKDKMKGMIKIKTDDEEKSKDSENASDNEKKSVEKNPVKPKQPLSQKTKPSDETPSKSKSDVADKSADKPKAEPVDKAKGEDPESKTKSVTEGKKNSEYTIQVASVRSQDEADKMITKLSSQGFSAYCSKVTSKDKTVWYRVRIGTFKDRGDADTMLNSVKKSKSSAMIIQK